MAPAVDWPGAVAGVDAAAGGGCCEATNVGDGGGGAAAAASGGGGAAAAGHAFEVAPAVLLELAPPNVGAGAAAADRPPAKSKDELAVACSIRCC